MKMILTVYIHLMYTIYIVLCTRFTERNVFMKLRMGEKLKD